MSLYNMINGFNPACILFLPMLGHKPSEYPRFRDCFLTEDNLICIFTRVGGYNRADYAEETKFMYDDPNFVRTEDDDFDSTYGSYIFKVPEKWKADFDKIYDGKLAEISDEYKKVILEIYPQMASIFEKAPKEGENEVN